jgi:hypothetical protein
MFTGDHSRIENKEKTMRLFTKKTNVRRSTRSRNRMFQNLDLNFEITPDDIPPFGVHWDPPARPVATLKKTA